MQFPQQLSDLEVLQLLVRLDAHLQVWLFREPIDHVLFQRFRIGRRAGVVERAVLGHLHDEVLGRRLIARYHAGRQLQIERGGCVRIALALIGDDRRSRDHEDDQQDEHDVDQRRQVQVN